MTFPKFAVLAILSQGIAGPNVEFAKTLENLASTTEDFRPTAHSLSTPTLPLSNDMINCKQQQKNIIYNLLLPSMGLFFAQALFSE